MLVAGVRATFTKISYDQVFEERAVPFGSLYLRPVAQLQKIGGQSGVGKVKFRGLHQPLAEVLKVGTDGKNDVALL